MKKHLFLIFFILSSISFIQANPSETLKNAFRYFYQASIAEMWNMLIEAQDYNFKSRELFLKAHEEFEKVEEISETFQEPWFLNFKDHFKRSSPKMSNKDFALACCKDGIGRTYLLSKYIPGKEKRTLRVENAIEDLVQWIPALILKWTQLSPKTIRYNHGKFEVTKIDESTLDELIKIVYEDEETELPLLQHKILMDRSPQTDPSNIEKLKTIIKEEEEEEEATNKGSQTELTSDCLINGEFK